VCDWSSNILAICFPVAQRREQPWWKHQGYFGYICKPKDKDGQRAEARHEKARQNVLILQSAWMPMMRTASCSTPCKFLSPRLLSYMQPVRLLVSASPNQSANSVFLSQQTSTSQPKSAQKPTSEQTDAVCCRRVALLSAKQMQFF